MKRLFLLIILACSFVPVAAQRYEVGISIGNANLIGDIGKTDYIEPPFPDKLTRVPLSLGLIYRYNLNSRQSLRLNFSYNKVYFNDEKAAEDYRYNRKAKGDNTIIEIAGLFEYNFFDINDERRYAFSPYIFGGVALYGYDDKAFAINHGPYRDANGNPRPLYPYGVQTSVTEAAETKFAFAIPFGVGVKFKFKYNWILGLELGARYTFQDDLDYSNVNSDKFSVNIESAIQADPYYRSLADQKTREIIGQHQTGSKGNDWYVIYGVNLTYTFGRPPCYCY